MKGHLCFCNIIRSYFRVWKVKYHLPFPFIYFLKIEVPVTHLEILSFIWSFWIYWSILLCGEYLDQNSIWLPPFCTSSLVSIAWHLKAHINLGPFNPFFHRQHCYGHSKAPVDLGETEGDEEFAFRDFKFWNSHTLMEFNFSTSVTKTSLKPFQFYELTANTKN